MNSNAFEGTVFYIIFRFGKRINKINRIISMHLLRQFSMTLYIDDKGYIIKCIEIHNIL